MKSTPSNYSMLFKAVREAHSAYVRLSAKGHGRPDQELARDPDYRRFHRSGMQLATLGGPEAIRGAIALLCQIEGEKAGAARRELERLWAGMDSWSRDTAPVQSWNGLNGAPH